MDILNFMSWIKAGNYRADLPTDTNNLIAVGTADPNRGDDYRPIAVNAAPLQSLYDGGIVTQDTDINTEVTLNALNGVITTQTASTAAGATDTFVFTNSRITANSVILLTAGYGGAGIPVLSLQGLTDGEVTIAITNADAAAALNGELTIHFLIIG